MSTFESALGHLLEGRYEAAIYDARCLLSSRAVMAEALNICALAYYSIGNGELALACAAEAASQEPENPDYRINFADICYVSGANELAAANYRMALRIAPQNEEAALKLSEIESALAKECKNAKRFLVTSQSLSGGKWLADALGQVPELVCTFGRGGAGTQVNLPLFGPAGADSEYGKIRVARIFRDCERLGHAKVYGNVAALTLAGYVQAEDLVAVDPTPIRIMNLLCHPVTMVEEVRCYIRREIGGNIFLARDVYKVVCEDPDFFMALTERHGLVPTDLDVVAFFAAAGCLSSLEQDLKAGDGVEQVSLEWLQGNATYFGQIAQRLVQGAMDAEPKFADILTAVGMACRPDADMLSGPSEHWDHWHCWEREIFEHMMDRHDIRSTYRRLGYRFDFMDC